MSLPLSDSCTHHAGFRTDMIELDDRKRIREEQKKNERHFPTNCFSLCTNTYWDTKTKRCLLVIDVIFIIDCSNYNITGHCNTTPVPLIVVTHDETDKETSKRLVHHPTKVDKGKVSHPAVASISMDNISLKSKNSNSSFTLIIFLFLSLKITPAHFLFLNLQQHLIKIHQHEPIQLIYHHPVSLLHWIQFYKLVEKDEQLFIEQVTNVHIKDD